MSNVQTFLFHRLKGDRKKTPFWIDQKIISIHLVNKCGEFDFETFNIWIKFKWTISGITFKKWCQIKWKRLDVEKNTASGNIVIIVVDGGSEKKIIWKNSSRLERIGQMESFCREFLHDFEYLFKHLKTNCRTKLVSKHSKKSSSDCRWLSIWIPPKIAYKIPIS